MGFIAVSGDGYDDVEEQLGHAYAVSLQAQFHSGPYIKMSSLYGQALTKALKDGYKPCSFSAGDDPFKDSTHYQGEGEGL